MKSTDSKFSYYIIILLSFTVILDLLIKSVQLRLFSKVIVDNRVIYIFIIILIYFRIIFFIKKKYNSHIFDTMMVISSIFLLTLVLLFIECCLDYGYSLHIYISILAFHFCNILCCLFILFPSTIKKVSITNLYKYNLVVLFGNIIISLLQHIFNDSLFYKSNELTVATSFFGKIRASGTTITGLSLGNYFLFNLCILIADILFNKYSSKKKRIGEYICIVVLFICIYFTYTRNIYLAVLVSILFLLFSKFFYKSIYYKKILRIIPIILIMTYTIYIIYKVKYLVYENTNEITDLGTFLYRYNTWKSCLSFFINFDINQKIIGTGILGYGFIKDFIYDNFYIQSLISNGILGLISLFLLYYSIFLKTLKLSVKNPIFIAFSSYLCSLFVIGFANVLDMYFQFFILVIVIICRDYELKNIEERKRTPIDDLEGSDNIQNENCICLSSNKFCKLK